MKSLTVYQYDKSVKIEDIRDILPDFTSCSPNAFFAHGFGDVFGEKSIVTDGLIATGYIREDKIIPSNAVKKLVKERVLKIMTEEDRKVSKREANEIKEDITIKKLPSCLTRMSYHDVIFDTLNCMIYIDATSTRAETIMALISQSFSKHDKDLHITRTIGYKHKFTDIIDDLLFNPFDVEYEGDFEVGKKATLLTEANSQMQVTFDEHSTLTALEKYKDDVQMSVKKLDIELPNVNFTIDRGMTITAVKYGNATKFPYASINPQLDEKLCESPDTDVYIDGTAAREITDFLRGVMGGFIKIEITKKEDEDDTNN